MNKTGPNSGHFWSIQYLMLIFAQIAPILSMVDANEYILVVFSVMYHQGMPHQYQGISCRQGVYVLIWVTLLFMVRFQKFQVLLSSLWKSKNILTKLTNWACPVVLRHTQSMVWQYVAILQNRGFVSSCILFCVYFTSAVVVYSQNLNDTAKTTKLKVQS